jgi:ATP-dependent DNA ligase I
MLRFAQTCNAVAATTRKTEKVRLVSGLLQSLPIEDAVRAATFLSGRPFPRWDERVLGIGGSLLARLIGELSATGSQAMSGAYRKHGDLGDMAEELLAGHADAPGVSLGEVAAVFGELAALRGQSEKTELLRRLLAKARPAEVKYIVKIMTGDLRIGLRESLVEEAIAQAYKRPVAAVRRANMLLGDIGETLQCAFRNELEAVRFRLFHPIDFMLASPVESSAEIFKNAVEPMVVEEKYDGIRAQAHKSAGRVKIFSRTLDEVVEFPELAPSLAALAGEYIVDGEILAWHDSQPLPFTQLQKRLGRRKPDLRLMEEIPVKFVLFDLLYCDGELLLDLPLLERRSRLKQLLRHGHPEQLQLAPERICKTREELDAAFRAALAAGHEGIVAKAPDSLYAPGRRGRFWFKLKEPFATLDVVVTAVEYGHGKRHGVLSDYTFAVREGDRLLNIGKAYSGLTDAEIREFTDYFLEHTVEDHGFRRVVEPKIVLEVAFNNIQRSQRHGSGFALRFPRIVRMRPDKTPEQIDTLGRVRELYARQITLPRSTSEVQEREVQESKVQESDPEAG